MADVEMAQLPVALGTQVLGEHVSPRRAALRRFLRYRLAIVGVFMLSVIILLAIFAPLLTPWPPNWVDFAAGARQHEDASNPDEQPVVYDAGNDR